MGLDAKAVRKPFQKLRKVLKHLPDSPAPKDVHDIRTNTRNIEAIVAVFGCLDHKSGSKIVKRLKPIRKTAGDVRDMDVLTQLAASLEAGEDGDCQQRLSQCLAERRTKAAAKLFGKVQAHLPEARDMLKKSGNLAVDGLQAANTRNGKPKDVQKSRQKSAGTMASALQIEQELRDWPNLTAKNIHPFRLKVKELRYVLQAAEERESKLIDALGNLKDQIGLWHDWDELSAIASEVLDHRSKCSIKEQIRTRTEQELEKAIRGANAFRRQYLQVESRRRTGGKSPTRELHPAAIKATARLAS